MIVYTDGSYIENSHCTYSFICLDENDENKIKYQFRRAERVREGKYIDSTYAELMAIKEVIRYAIDNQQMIIIYSDYETVINIINKGKKKYNKIKKEYIKEFVDFMRKHEDIYQIKYVKAHKKNKYNNYVDRICRTKTIEEKIYYKHSIDSLELRG